MKRRTLKQLWDEFFFLPQSTAPLSAFRIAYGLCVLITLYLLHADWLDWFGTNAWISSETMQRLEPGMRINVFTLMPEENAWISAFFWVFVVCALLLTLGLWTRAMAILNFVCLTSLHQRNLMITHGGDTFLRVTGFFLMFAPAGSLFSLDAWRRRQRGLPPALEASPWAQRLIQAELSLLYITSFLWKVKGTAWLDGTALFYVVHLSELQRFPIPSFLLVPTLLKLGTWLVLLFEFVVGIGIWWKPMRHPLLVLGLFFHLCLEYALNIPMFQWDVLTAYLLFSNPRYLGGWELQSHASQQLDGSSELRWDHASSNHSRPLDGFGLVKDYRPHIALSDD